MIKANDLSYSFGKDTNLALPNLFCGSGQGLLILGASGSGKTTYLHLLAGLRKSTSGQVFVDGKEMNKMSDRKLDRFRGREIGIVFQQAHFIPSLRVKENLSLSMKLAGKMINKERIRYYLAHLNISHKANSFPNQLSVGEQQRLSIAMALINQPKVVLADEPTSALDDQNAEQVIGLLKNETKELNSALVIVTHDQRMKDHFSNHIHL